jgi:hypothetical protein
MGSVKVLLTNGDSWAFGSEIIAPSLRQDSTQKFHPFTNPVIGDIHSHDLRLINDPYRIANIWPTHLSLALGAKNINIGIGAASNDVIYETTIAWLLENYIVPKKDASELLVVVGWSSPERKTVMFEDYAGKVNKLIFWPTMDETKYYRTDLGKKYFDFYSRHLWFEREYITRYVEQHYMLYIFCKAHNINLVMFDSFNSPKSTTLKDWDELVPDIINKWTPLSIDGWLHDDRSDKKRLVSMWGEIPPNVMINKNKNPRSFKGYIDQTLGEVEGMNNMHPSEESHKVWADYIRKYMVENGVI